MWYFCAFQRGGGLYRIHGKQEEFISVQNPKAALRINTEHPGEAFHKRAFDTDAGLSSHAVKLKWKGLTERAK